MTLWETVWTFNTARVAVLLQVTPCREDPADNFQFAEDIEAVRSGSVAWFDARVIVLIDGREVGSDYLGCCAYESAQEFVTHGCGYFIDMVRSAVGEARLYLNSLPNLRKA